MLNYLDRTNSVRIPNLVKWAGGKGNLVDSLIPLIPEDFSTYFEPFFGGGALFWNLKANKKIHDAVISDSNPDLINLLNTIKREPEDLKLEVGKYSDFKDRDKYYKVRARFNEIKKEVNMEVERAAMFLYLNRNCFNGLWRTNKKGEFNVPYGFSENFHLATGSEIDIYSDLLTDTAIIYGDYSNAIKKCDEEDFVYFDPPYHTEFGFTQYNGDKFTITEQIQLFKSFTQLSNKGTRLLQSNSDHPEILKLYGDYRIKKIEGRSVIGANSLRRGKKEEIIIMNY